MENQEVLYFLSLPYLLAKVELNRMKAKKNLDQQLFKYLFTLLLIYILSLHIENEIKYFLLFKQIK